MIKEIIKSPNIILTTVSQAVKDTDEIEDLVTNLIDTLNDRENPGLGLAAPQLGENKSIFVMKIGIDSEVTPLLYKENRVIINPEIVKVSKKTTMAREGCLSIPEHLAITSRYKKIKVKYQDVNKKYHTEWFEGTDSIVFQHEFNHLIGRTLIEDAVKLLDAPKKHKKEKEVSNTDFV